MGLWSIACPRINRIELYPVYNCDGAVRKQLDANLLLDYPEGAYYFLEKRAYVVVKPFASRWDHDERGPGGKPSHKVKVKLQAGVRIDVLQTASVAMRADEDASNSSSTASTGSNFFKTAGGRRRSKGPL